MNTRHALIIAACLLCLLSWVQAGSVYKCTSNAAKVYFSDIPCPVDHKTSKLRTVESVIDGTGDWITGAEEKAAKGRDEAERNIWPLGNETLYIGGQRFASRGKASCNVARREYAEAKRHLRCWAAQSCESDHTRELFARVERTCNQTEDNEQSP